MKNLISASPPASAHTGVLDAPALQTRPRMTPDRPALHYALFALPTFTSRRMSGVISFTPRARLAWKGSPPQILRHEVTGVIIDRNAGSVRLHMLWDKVRCLERRLWLVWVGD